MGISGPPPKSHFVLCNFDLEYKQEKEFKNYKKFSL